MFKADRVSCLMHLALSSLYISPINCLNHLSTTSSFFRIFPNAEPNSAVIPIKAPYMERRKSEMPRSPILPKWYRYQYELQSICTLYITKYFLIHILKLKWFCTKPFYFCPFERFSIENCLINMIKNNKMTMERTGMPNSVGETNKHLSQDPAKLNNFLT